VAHKDYLQFFVEKIIQHTGDPKKLHTLKFQVKWPGYDTGENTWKPWKHLHNNEMMRGI
jgi:hypothetical protein